AAERDPAGGLEGVGARPRRGAADLASARSRQRLGRRRAAALPRPRAGARERSGPRGRLLSGAAGRMSIDTLRLTAEEAHDLLRRKEVSGDELHRAYLDAIDER